MHREEPHLGLRYRAEGRCGEQRTVRGRHCLTHNAHGLNLEAIPTLRDGAVPRGKTDPKVSTVQKWQRALEPGGVKVMMLTMRTAHGHEKEVRGRR
jgi:hypothetical protein